MSNLENSLNESLSLLKSNKHNEALEILKKIEIEDSRVFFLLGTIYSVMKNINLGEEFLIRLFKTLVKWLLSIKTFGSCFSFKKD